MRQPPTAFPHPDIPDEPREPLITAALSAFTRDDPRYRRLPDHDANGLFHGGPEGERDALVQLVGYQHCAVSASTPENERRQHVVYRARKAVEQQEYEQAANPTPPRSGYGLYGRPRKPAASGRRKKVA